MATISEWLKSKQNYKEGVALYEQYGDNTVLLLLFKKSENAYTKKKLAEELERIITADSVENSPIPPQRAPLTKVQSNKSHPTLEIRDVGIDALDCEKQEYPTKIKELIEYRQTLYRERDYMKAQLGVISKKLREDYCWRIVDNTKKIKQTWKEFDHWKATGAFLDRDNVETKSTLSLFEVERSIRNARSNVSKHKKRGTNKLLDWELKLAALEKQKEDLINAI